MRHSAIYHPPKMGMRDGEFWPNGSDVYGKFFATKPNGGTCFAKGLAELKKQIESVPHFNDELLEVTWRGHQLRLWDDTRNHRALRFAPESLGIFIQEIESDRRAAVAVRAESFHNQVPDRGGSFFIDRTNHQLGGPGTPSKETVVYPQPGDYLDEYTLQRMIHGKGLLGSHQSVWPAVVDRLNNHAANRDSLLVDTDGGAEFEHSGAKLRVRGEKFGNWRLADAALPSYLELLKREAMRDNQVGRLNPIDHPATAATR